LALALLGCDESFFANLPSHVGDPTDVEEENRGERGAKDSRALDARLVPAVRERGGRERGRGRARRDSSQSSPARGDAVSSLDVVMHRMGSYFEAASSQATSVPADGQHHQHHQLRSILASGPPKEAPPTPPPTSSIPKTRQRWTDNKHFGKPVDRVRRNVQRLQRSGQELVGQPISRRLASLTLADMPPALVLRRVRTLCSQGDAREAAALLRRLPPATFRLVASDLPLAELAAGDLPAAVPVIEAAYARAMNSGNGQGPDRTGLRLVSGLAPEELVWQIVRFFASQGADAAGATGRLELCGPWVSTCRRLLISLATAEPHLRRRVAERRRALSRAIEGLGQHGVVGTSEGEALVGLAEALRAELAGAQKACSEAATRLDTICPPSKGLGRRGQADPTTSGAGKRAPVAQSHQRQLSLRVEEIQERLIRNKTLLDAACGPPSVTEKGQALEVLLGILQRRIELDKEVSGR